MSQLDNLPPDQRAVLSLLLRQGKSYGEVAAKLTSTRPRCASGRRRRWRRWGRAHLRAHPRAPGGDRRLPARPAKRLRARRRPGAIWRDRPPDAAGRRVVSGSCVLPTVRRAALPDDPGRGRDESDGRARPRPSDAAGPDAAAAGGHRRRARRGRRGEGRGGEPRPAGAPRRRCGRRSPRSRVGGLLLLLGLGAAIAAGRRAAGQRRVAAAARAADRDRKDAPRRPPRTGTSTASAQVFAQAALAPVQRGQQASAQLAVVAQPGNQPRAGLPRQGLPADAGLHVRAVADQQQQGRWPRSACCRRSSQTAPPRQQSRSCPTVSGVDERRLPSRPTTRASSWSSSRVRPATARPVRGRSCSWRADPRRRLSAGSVDEQLAGVHDARRVQVGLERAQRLNPLRAHLVAHPGRVIASHGVVMGDGRRRG